MMRKIEKETNIAAFKNKQQKFCEWLEEVINSNFKEEKPIVKNAMVLWTEVDAEGKEHKFLAKFDCGLEEHNEFAAFLQRILLHQMFDDYLREHISDYLEYVN